MNITDNKQLKFLTLIFVIVSVIHIVYAAIVMRGLYFDGVSYFITVLNNFANGNSGFVFDDGHPRFFAVMMAQCPLYLFFLGIKNKFALMMLFSFFHFLLPLLILFWNFNLTKRTKRYDIFFWSLFSYCGILILFSVYSIVESFLCGLLFFVLWNYLASNIKYTKWDKVCILILLFSMFGIYEYVIFLGIGFFVASVYYSIKTENMQDKFEKLFIGTGSLIAALYSLLYTLGVDGNNNEIFRFFNEAIDFLPKLLNLNASMTILAVVLFIICCFLKKKFNNISISVVFIFFAIAFIRLLSIKYLSVNPVLEGHLRTIPIWVFPLIFLSMFLSDVLKKEIDEVKLHNLFCIVLVLGIFQTCWQMINSYYWNENIQYMNRVLNKSTTPLFIPSQHKEISSFNNNKLRRYIWHCVYSVTSIAFSETYKQKTLLVNYDKINEKDNFTFREVLYIPANNDNLMVVPLGGNAINVKNQFWDLTDCAKALKKYDKENNINVKSINSKI